MDILFVINTLNGGGAEKVFIDTIKLLDKKNYNIDILVVDDYGQFQSELRSVLPYRSIIKHASSPLILRFWLGGISWIKSKFFKYAPARILHRWCVKKAYDIEVGYLEGVSTKIVSGCTRKKTVTYAWVHTDMIDNPWTTDQYRSSKEEVFAYQQIDNVIAVSRAVKSAFEKKFKQEAKVLYNVLDNQAIIQKAKVGKRRLRRSTCINLISVGSLWQTKGYMRLIKIMHQIITSGLSARLHIVGEGVERVQMEEYIRENQLEDDIIMYGFQKEPYDLMKQADVYVCSSYAEGFSTTVTEALILGLPIVTTNCAGMNELLGESQYGLITENTSESLFNGLKEIIENDKLREEYAKRAEMRGVFFSSEKTLHHLENAFANNIKQNEQEEQL